MDSNRYWLDKRANQGFRGYPVATIAYYGPDASRATKVAVGILVAEDDLAHMEKWFSEESDVRQQVDISRQIVEFLGQHQVKSLVMTDRVIGCPHEEGIDYPEGQSCPRCPFWIGRDRWTGSSRN
jgi:hypothetical protein